MTGASCCTVVKVAPMAVAGVVECVEVMIPAALALCCFRMTQQKTVIIIATNVMNTAIINGGTMSSIPVIKGNVTYHYKSVTAAIQQVLHCAQLTIELHVTLQAQSG